MRVLLDTNIIIHRERSNIVRDDIGILFGWLDKISASKHVHPGTIDELERHADAEVVRAMKIKAQHYRILKTLAPDSPEIAKIRKRDGTGNNRLDTDLLAELHAARVDVLVTEDRGIHRKAVELGLSSSVFTIDAFLEKVTAENPGLADYQVLAVRKAHFGDLALEDTFFDSFRRDYSGFDRWFSRKSDEIAYICNDEEGAIVAFLYVKPEDEREVYSDVSPILAPKKLLKIGTFKVIANGFKLGERFLKIAFDNALAQSSEEVYVTIFKKSQEHERLIDLLKDWGFVYHGVKISAGGDEDVYIRDMTPKVDPTDPRKSYPFVAGASKTFIVPIYPEYHTELLPDSILTTESEAGFVENRPNRNAISKVYVSRSVERSLSPGDTVVFYRTATRGTPAHFSSVATTLGVVQEVIMDIKDKATFMRACRKRSVFTDSELEEHWDYNPNSRPFVVNFLYVHAFPRRPNLRELKEAGIIADAPRGFDLLTEAAFNRLLEISNADQRIIVN